MIGKIDLPPVYPDLHLQSIQLEREARRYGRMEIACELAEWVNDHADELAPHLREQLANLIFSAPTPRDKR